MACLLKKELNHGEKKGWLWTDSKAVIGYVKNNVRRMKTFVVKREQQIREDTDVQQLHYIPTREDLADGASRGLNEARAHSGKC